MDREAQVSYGIAMRLGWGVGTAELKCERGQAVDVSAEIS